MKVLINFAALKSGGGQNVALNFLYSLLGHKHEGIEFYFFVARDSDLHRVLRENAQCHYSVLPRNPIARICFELFLSKKILLKNQIDVVYSYFGIACYTRGIPQVSGSADSNLFFPEIDFWSEYKGLQRLRRWIVDRYRIWGLKRADAVVFENEVMETRSHELFKLKKTRFIKPSVNFTSLSSEYSLPVVVPEGMAKGLFLCGWQRNKNYMLIPEIACELKRKGHTLHFILTAPIDYGSEHKAFLESLKHWDVEELVSIVGQVDKEQLASLYQQVDFIFLLSKLESFSNNIIEAWYFRKPLFVAEEAWSQAICKDGAVYVERGSASRVAEAVISLIEDKEMLLEIVNNGSKQLQTYPSIDERTIEEISFLKDVKRNF